MSRFFYKVVEYFFPSVTGEEFDKIVSLYALGFEPRYTVEKLESIRNLRHRYVHPKLPKKGDSTLEDIRRLAEIMLGNPPSEEDTNELRRIARITDCLQKTNSTLPDLGVQDIKILAEIILEDSNCSSERLKEIAKKLLNNPGRNKADEKTFKQRLLKNPLSKENIKKLEQKSLSNLSYSKNRLGSTTG